MRWMDACRPSRLAKSEVIPSNSLPGRAQAMYLEREKTSLVIDADVEPTALGRVNTIRLARTSEVPTLYAAIGGRRRPPIAPTTVSWVPPCKPSRRRGR